MDAKKQYGTRERKLKCHLVMSKIRFKIASQLKIVLNNSFLLNYRLLLFLKRAKSKKFYLFQTKSVKNKTILCKLFIKRPYKKLRLP